MRKLIAGMKISVDGKMEGPEGYADWVEAWSEDYGLTQQIDACVVGGGMYPHYEQYWTTIQNEPESQSRTRFQRKVRSNGPVSLSRPRIMCCRAP